MHSYDYANKLFLSLGEIDHDPLEYLQRSLRNQDQKWLKFTSSSREYQTPIISPILYIEWRTG